MKSLPLGGEEKTADPKKAANKHGRRS